MPRITLASQKAEYEAKLADLNDRCRRVEAQLAAKLNRPFRAAYNSWRPVLEEITGDDFDELVSEVRAEVTRRNLRVGEQVQAALDQDVVKYQGEILRRTKNGRFEDAEAEALRWMAYADSLRAEIEAKEKAPKALASEAGLSWFD